MLYDDIPIEGDYSSEFCVEGVCCIEREDFVRCKHTGPCSHSKICPTNVNCVEAERVSVRVCVFVLHECLGLNVSMCESIIPVVARRLLILSIRSSSSLKPQYKSNNLN